MLEKSLDSEKRLLQTQKRSRMRHRMDNTGGDLNKGAGSAELQCLIWESSRLTKNPL